MRKAYGYPTIAQYDGKKAIVIMMWSGNLEWWFDYKTMNLVMVEDTHTGEWATYETKDELAWVKKYYSVPYAYARRRAREFKESKTKKRK